MMGTKLSIHEAEKVTFKHRSQDAFEVAEFHVALPRNQYAAIDLFDLPAAELDAACLAYLAKRGWMFIPEHKVAVEAKRELRMADCLKPAFEGMTPLESARAAALVARARMVAIAAAAAAAERAYVKAIDACVALPDDVSLARATDPDA